MAFNIDGFLSNAISFTKNDLSVGQHKIYLKVKDNKGEWSSENSIDVIILSESQNNAPIAMSGGPYSGTANQGVTFDGSQSFDPDEGDSIASYKWDFGDVSIGEGATPEHTYTSEGEYTVELTVTDSNGEQTKITTTVNIEASVNGQSGGGNTEEEKGIPGFEVLLVFIAIAFILFVKKCSPGPTVMKVTAP